MSNNKEWYISLHGEPEGPMTLEELKPRVLSPDTMVYGPSTQQQWVEAREVKELYATPTLPQGDQVHGTSLEYEIIGDDMQFLNIKMQPGQRVISEPGTMMYMTSGLRMETVFGNPGENQGVFNKMLSAGKRALTGESLFLTTYVSEAPAGDTIAFAAPYPGHIIPMDLQQLGGEILCQKDSFLAASWGTDVGVAFQRKVGVGLFGGEGFILQRLRGQGLGFVHAGGTIYEKTLGNGETIKLDTGCLVAFQTTVQYDIQFTGGIKNSLFGGEGMFLTTLTGPGKIWLQSLPFARLAGRMVSGFSKGRGEGSAIGKLGNLFEQ